MCTLNQEELANIFYENLNQISQGLISAFSLKFEREVDHLSLPLLRWLDFRLRYVNPRPRKVVLSDKFPISGLSDEALSGLNRLIRIFETGGDVNPYQGQGLVNFNDTSGRRKSNRTDGLWADWGVSHFHLSDGDVVVGDYFVKRGDHLLCIVEEDRVLFIDARSHLRGVEYADLDIVEIIAGNWPERMVQLKGVLPGKVCEGDEIYQMRRSGVSAPLVLGGKVYFMAGSGITSAATADVVTVAVNRCRLYVKRLAEWVASPDGDFVRTCRWLSVDNPAFCLAITPRGLSVYEENSRAAFSLSYMNFKLNWIDDLNSTVLPSWALKVYLEAAE
ncbi:hypothetical protein [Chromobacterium sphagni]|uniref:hypothetical protein n=1 Tax=Chromobacterium sphagni TaxID=1903179 RepID=UPI000A599CBC|nr:hypothetical protein [Chromobacterium sphagni]